MRDGGSNPPGKTKTLQHKETMDNKQPPLIDPFEFTTDVPPKWSSKLDITLVHEDDVKLPVKESLWSKFCKLFRKSKTND